MEQFRVFLMGRCVKLNSFLNEFKSMCSPHGEITTSYWFDSHKAKRVTYEEYIITIVLELTKVTKKFQLYDDGALKELDYDDALEEFIEFCNETKPSNREEKVSSKTADNVVPGKCMYDVYFCCCCTYFTIPHLFSICYNLHRRICNVSSCS